MSSQVPPQKAVVLVSGATRGIGKAIAGHLIVSGYRVSLGARDVKKLVQEFGPETDTIHHARFDAANNQTMVEWVSAAHAKFGRIDGLVNNAGIGAKDPNNFMAGTPEELQSVMQVDVIAPWRLIQLCMPHLEETGAGRIINISSLSGLRVNGSNNAIYNAAKHALQGITGTARFHGSTRNVRTTSICTGWVATDLSRHSKVPQADMTQPETVAATVKFLLTLPNNAAIANLTLNCEHEPLY